MERLAMGIAAHVDAGKTTLTEAMLYLSGSTERLGRVDKGDAHLDTHSLERARGITIFSKTATLKLKTRDITIVDTPGHVDFATECERALAVEDYAILVVSAPDGVTAHTKTIWSLLRSRHIPTFIFVNKCDIAERRREDLLSELKIALSGGVVDFTRDEGADFSEAVAATDTRLMDEFFNTESVSCESICEAISRGSVFPCYFGSALKLVGVRELLSGIEKYTVSPGFPADIFGARVYKIDRDAAGRRVAFTKITGGSLVPKTVIEYTDKNGETVSEKVEEIRRYDGERSSPVKCATAGMIVALHGLSGVEAGMGLGFEKNDSSMLSPVLNYSLILPGDVNPYEAYLKISPLAEEDPSLGMHYDAEAKEIKISLMGDIAKEVLSEIIEKRFGISVGFDEGQILYRETVSEPVLGRGHFEPLMHYAEVHLRLDPMPEGTGIIAATECPTDTLALSWQRLIMTHIKEKRHKGTLTGSPLTDVKITLIAGKAHQKHTSGGDFRQATYRAIRQALRKAGSVLLEPTLDFEIDLPEELVGRAITDITKMRGTPEPPEFKDGRAILRGNCPAETVRGYPITLRAYTRGEGRISLSPAGYKPHTEPDGVIEKIGYDVERDERNTADSVFCKAGSGYTVPWYEADALMHIKPDEREAPTEDGEYTVPERARSHTYGGTAKEDRELEKIFEATYGKIKPREVAERRENAAGDAPEKKHERKRPPKKPSAEYVILDGYNVIFAWDRLRPTDKVDFDLSREVLIRLMCNYTAFRGCRAIIVFDAYRVKDGKGSVEKYGDVTVVYTKTRETADSYIERVTHDISKDNLVRVVTSDMEEQYIILGNGALRVSPREFLAELGTTDAEIGDLISARGKSR